MSSLKSKAVKNRGQFKKGSKPYNRYNCFFVLERERIVLSKGGSSKWSCASTSPPPPTAAADPRSALVRGYDGLWLPPLPPRFAHLDPPEGWYIPKWNQGVRRKHRKSHGVASFKGIAQDVARNWKAIDQVTFAWTVEVEKILRQRYLELQEEEKGRELLEEEEGQDSPPAEEHRGESPSTATAAEQRALPLPLVVTPPASPVAKKAPGRAVANALPAKRKAPATAGPAGNPGAGGTAAGPVGHVEKALRYFEGVGHAREGFLGLLALRGGDGGSGTGVRETEVKLPLKKRLMRTFTNKVDAAAASPPLVLCGQCEETVADPEADAGSDGNGGATNATLLLPPGWRHGSRTGAAPRTARADALPSKPRAPEATGKVGAAAARLPLVLCGQCEETAAAPGADAGSDSNGGATGPPLLIPPGWRRGINQDSDRAYYYRYLPEAARSA